MTYHKNNKQEKDLKKKIVHNIFYRKPENNMFYYKSSNATTYMNVNMYFTSEPFTIEFWLSLLSNNN